MSAKENLNTLHTRKTLDYGKATGTKDEGPAIAARREMLAIIAQGPAPFKGTGSVSKASSIGNRCLRGKAAKKAA